MQVHATNIVHVERPFVSSNRFDPRSSYAWASEKVTDSNTSLYLDTFRNISGAELIKRSLECKIKAARTSLVDEEDTREDEERNGERRPEINAYACPERNELEFIT